MQAGRAMHLYITARNFELTEGIREHVMAHIVKPVEHHGGAHDLTRIEVQLSTGQRDALYACHVLVQLTGHRDINISEHNHDLYAAIDLAEKRLLPVLTGLRETQLTKKRHPRKFSWRKVSEILRRA
jgi:ribosomal subunit interface protein